MVLPHKPGNNFNNAANKPVPPDEAAKFITAARGNDTATLRSLLQKHGKGLLEFRESGGDTALTWAAWLGHKESVTLLLQAGADIDKPGMTGRPAISWAAMGGRTEVVKLLLEQGAATDIKDNDGRTALVLAQMGRHDAVEKALLENDGSRTRSAQAKVQEEASRVQRDAAIEALKRQRPNFRLKK